ncbi:MAG: CsgG/HfaB family protein [Steroidobacteraceae bacterium]
MRISTAALATMTIASCLSVAVDGSTARAGNSDDGPVVDQPKGLSALPRRPLNERVPVTVYQFHSDVPEVQALAAADMFTTALLASGQFRVVQSGQPTQSGGNFPQPYQQQYPQQVQQQYPQQVQQQYPQQYQQPMGTPQPNGSYQQQPMGVPPANGRYPQQPMGTPQGTVAYPQQPMGTPQGTVAYQQPMGMPQANGINQQQPMGMPQANGTPPQYPLHVAQYIFDGTVSEFSAGQSQKQGGVAMGGLNVGGADNKDMIAIDVRIIDGQSGDILDSVSVREAIKSSNKALSGTAAAASTLASYFGKTANPMTPDVNYQTAQKGNVDTALRNCIDLAVLQLVQRMSLAGNTGGAAK